MSNLIGRSEHRRTAYDLYWLMLPAYASVVATPSASGDDPSLRWARPRGWVIGVRLSIFGEARHWLFCEDVL